jgi:hypothetical protein
MIREQSADKGYVFFSENTALDGARERHAPIDYKTGGN